MNLAVDIGNSAVKAALFDKGWLVRLLGEAEIPEADYRRVIVVSTRGAETESEKRIMELTERNGGRFLKFDHSTPVPVKNLYATPETLGCDRLAAAVGAHGMFPDSTVLVVDFGTAITYDVVTAEGEFLGGNISPGAGCRFRALKEFTGALPLGTLPGMAEAAGVSTAATENEAAAPLEFPAKTTISAIENGVASGITAETEYYIGLAKEKWGEIEIIFTGGDAEYFAKRVKFPIFAVSDIVFRGLNAILEYNANS